MNKLKKLAIAISLLMVSAFAQNSSTQQMAGVGSWGEGDYYAPSYNYQTSVFSGGSTAGGTYTITLFKPFVTLPGGRNVAIFNSGTAMPPITIGQGAAKETVTPSSSSGCNSFNQGVGSATCTITAAFTNAHGQGDIIVSGSAGLQEAVNDAQSHGGGNVVIDSIWTALGGTSAIVGTAIPYQNVTIQDKRGVPQFWNAQGGATTLAAPTTLTAVTALPSAAPVGAFGTGTYHMCIAYVDIAGQEGPCSADFSEAGLATGSFIFSPPAASTGAVGYTIYIGLTGGGVTNLNYKVPLTSSICTLSTVETITAACNVTNATYGTTGATATVIAITVNTSPIQPAITTVSTTSVYVPNAGGRTTYTFSPGSHVGTPGVVSAYLPFTISAAEATTVPSVIGTMNVGPGVMNYVGATIEVCGRATSTASTATIVHIQFQWDAFGQNTAGKGVVIGDLALTPVAAFSTTKVLSFCEQFVTTVAGASATAGSIIPAGGFLNTSGVSAAAAGQGGGADAASLGAVASLNLASEARINVISLHTTGTDGAAVTLQGLTVKRIN